MSLPELLRHLDDVERRGSRASLANLRLCFGRATLRAARERGLVAYAGFAPRTVRLAMRGTATEATASALSARRAARAARDGGVRRPDAGASSVSYLRRPTPASAGQARPDVACTDSGNRRTS